MTTPKFMGHLQCGEHQLQIVRTDFVRGMMVVWGMTFGPMPAYSGPVKIFGWDGIPFFGTEDPDNDSRVAWGKVRKGDCLTLPLVIGDADDEHIKAFIKQGRQEILELTSARKERT